EDRSSERGLAPDLGRSIGGRDVDSLDQSAGRAVEHVRASLVDDASDVDAERGDEDLVHAVAGDVGQAADVAAEARERAARGVVRRVDRPDQGAVLAADHEDLSLAASVLVGADDQVSDSVSVEIAAVHEADPEIAAHGRARTV